MLERDKRYIMITKQDIEAVKAEKLSSKPKEKNCHESRGIVRTKK